MLVLMTQRRCQSLRFLQNAYWWLCCRKQTHASEQGGTPQSLGFKTQRWGQSQHSRWYQHRSLCPGVTSPGPPEFGTTWNPFISRLCYHLQSCCGSVKPAMCSVMTDSSTSLLSLFFTSIFGLGQCQKDVIEDTAVSWELRAALTVISVSTVLLLSHGCGESPAKAHGLRI